MCRLCSVLIEERYAKQISRMMSDDGEGRDVRYLSAAELHRFRVLFLLVRG